jgi:hypothetical protein
MKNWGIFTIIYVLITAWLASKANDNMFGPDMKGTVLVAVVIYVVLLVVFLIVRKVRNSPKSS